MALYEELTAVHAVIPGVSALTTRGRRACVPPSQLKHDARRLLAGDAGAFAYVADGGAGSGGQEVIAVLTDTVLVREEVLELVGREVLIDVGGEGRFADPETALFDVQWRLNLLGSRVLTTVGEPAPAVPATRAQRLMRRRGMLSILDVVLSDEWRSALVPVAQMLDITRAHALASTDTTALDLQRSPGGDDVGDLTVATDSLLGAFAVDGALDNLADLQGVREHIQRVRRVPDAGIAVLIGRALPQVLGIEEDGDRRRFDRLASLLGLDAVVWKGVHALVVAPSDGAGAARAAALVERLGREVETRLADSETGTVTSRGEVLEGLTAEHVPWADVIVLVGTVLDDAPGCASSNIPLLADFSSIDVLGWLMNTSRSNDRSTAFAKILARADKVLVADAVQRDLLLGALAGAGRVNDVVYDDDPSLNGLVEIDHETDALVAFCRRPVRAADAGDSPADAQAPKPNDLALAVQYLREGGVRNVLTKAAGRVRRVVGTPKEGN